VVGARAWTALSCCGQAEVYSRAEARARDVRGRARRRLIGREQTSLGERRAARYGSDSHGQLQSEGRAIRSLCVWARGSCSRRASQGLLGVGPVCWAGVCSQHHPAPSSKHPAASTQQQAPRTAHHAPRTAHQAPRANLRGTLLGAAVTSAGERSAQPAPTSSPRLSQHLSPRPRPRPRPRRVRPTPAVHRQQEHIGTRRED
jgi:hypothetical protein